MVDERASPRWEASRRACKKIEEVLDDGVGVGWVPLSGFKPDFYSELAAKCTSPALQKMTENRGLDSQLIGARHCSLAARFDTFYVEVKFTQRPIALLQPEKGR